MNNTSTSKVLELLNSTEAKDENRIALIHENPDWENRISPALGEMGDMQERGLLDLNTVRGATFLRVLFEAIYCIGHKTGKNEQSS